MKSLFVALCAAVFSLEVGQTSVGCAAEIADAIVSLQRHPGGIDSISSRFVQEREGELPDGVSRTAAWGSLQSGRLFLLTLNAKLTGEGLARSSGWHSFDGERYLHTQLDPDDPGRILAVESKSDNSDSVPNMYELPRSMHFVAQPVLYSSQTLVDLLQLPTATSRGEESIGGHQCLRVDVPEFLTVYGTKRQLFAWLDPRVGYLPRRYIVAEPEITVDEVGTTADHNWVQIDVVNFQMLKDHITGEVKPFPSLAVMTGSGGRANYTFDEVELNVSLDREDFQPKAPPGAELIIKEPGQPDQISIIGGQAAVRATQKQIATLAMDLSSAGPPVVTAKPPSWSVFVYIAIAIGIALSTLLFHRRFST